MEPSRCKILPRGQTGRLARQRGQAQRTCRRLGGPPFQPSGEKQTGTLRLNGGHTEPLKVQSPVERVQSEFALPEDVGLNPCRKGLVQNPADWQYSSAGFWINGEPGRIPLSVIEW